MREPVYTSRVVYMTNTNSSIRLLRTSRRGIVSHVARVVRGDNVATVTYARSIERVVIVESGAIVGEGTLLETVADAEAFVAEFLDTRWA